MALSIALLFIVAIIIPFIYKKSKKVALIILLGLVGYINYYFFNLLLEVVDGKVFSNSYEWIPALQINLSFYLDGLSLFFSILISFLGFLIVLYSSKYIKGHTYEEQFFAYLIFFMGSMLGVVLSANLISLFIFWELTSLSSFLLIGFNSDNKSSRYAARQALLITAGGGLALMSAFILINISTDSYNFIDILNRKEFILDSALLPAIIILLLLGAFTKSAQFPFHFWLPNAMAAPTPVSAYLHSATMVKAGVYLVFRFNPVFADVILWQNLLMIFGAFTMVYASLKAIQADDLKGILAFTTISALGIFFMMVGVGTQAAIQGAVIYVLAHAMYKGGLFLVAGNIDHEAGTRKLSDLSGIAKKMPYTAFAAIATAISMAGLIPSKGFMGKELLSNALLNHEMGTVLLVLLILASAFFVYVAILIGYQMLFGKLHPKSAKEANKLMFLPPVILGALGFLLAIFPQLFSQPLLSIASDNIMGEAVKMDLKLWHGFNLEFWLSMGALLVGIIFYLIRKPTLTLWNKNNIFRKVKSDNIYRALVKGIGSTARLQTGFVQNGYLRNYISIFIAVFCIFVFAMYYKHPFSLDFISSSWHNTDVFEVAILLLVFIAILILFTTHSRMIVIATLSIIGYAIALAYALFSAPDVAMTQFLAETLILIMVILILHKLPRYVISGLKVKFKYLITSIVFGLLMTGISMLMLSKEIDSGLKEYFLTNSVTAGKGENVVNVILVDFRALDTLGEITVLTITMIGIIALMTINVKQKK